MVCQQVLLKRLNIGAAVPYTWGSLAFLPFEMCFNLWWYQSKIDLELVGPFLAAPLCPQPPIITDQTYIKRRTHQGVGLSIWNYTKGATVVWKLSASLNHKRNPDITVSYSNSKLIWPDTEMVWSASECDWWMSGRVHFAARLWWRHPSNCGAGSQTICQHFIHSPWPEQGHGEGSWNHLTIYLFCTTCQISFDKLAKPCY